MRLIDADALKINLETFATVHGMSDFYSRHEVLDSIRRARRQRFRKYWKVTAENGDLTASRRFKSVPRFGHLAISQAESVTSHEARALSAMDGIWMF